jgi:hypothetical protein
MIKGVTHAHLGPIWYHSELSDVPYSSNQFLGRDFFAISYNKEALDFLAKNRQAGNYCKHLVKKYSHGFLKVPTKIPTENWVIEAPSVGTILAYLETTG